MLDNLLAAQKSSSSTQDVIGTEAGPSTSRHDDSDAHTVNPTPTKNEAGSSAVNDPHDADESDFMDSALIPYFPESFWNVEVPEPCQVIQHVL